MKTPGTRSCGLRLLVPRLEKGSQTSTPGVSYSGLCVEGHGGPGDREGVSVLVDPRGTPRVPL